MFSTETIVIVLAAALACLTSGAGAQFTMQQQQQQPMQPMQQPLFPNQPLQQPQPQQQQQQQQPQWSSGFGAGQQQPMGAAAGAMTPVGQQPQPQQMQPAVDIAGVPMHTEQGQASTTLSQGSQPAAEAKLDIPYPGNVRALMGKNHLPADAYAWTPQQIHGKEGERERGGGHHPARISSFYTLTMKGTNWISGIKF